MAVTDVSTGLYVHGAILAALLSRQQTGKGVWIDCNLFETQIAGLANVASAWLIAGEEGARHGTSHPSIVPYQVFPCGNGGFLMIGAGNNKQFSQLSTNILKQPDLVDDPRFATNTLRVKHREELVKIITDTLMKEDRDYWLKAFTGQGYAFQTLASSLTKVSAPIDDHDIFDWSPKGFHSVQLTTSSRRFRIRKPLPGR